MKIWPRCGMTLIELILTVALGSLLILGVVLFTRHQVVDGVKLRDFLIAKNLARLKMADMNNQAFSSLPEGIFDYSDEPSFPGFKTRRITNLVTSTSVTSQGVVMVRRIEMLVDYKTGDFSKPLVKLITYRQSHVNFG